MIGGMCIRWLSARAKGFSVPPTGIECVKCRVCGHYAAGANMTLLHTCLEAGPEAVCLGGGHRCQPRCPAQELRQSRQSESAADSGVAAAVADIVTFWKKKACRKTTAHCTRETL
jgi:hypothetical protein